MNKELSSEMLLRAKTLGSIARMNKHDRIPEQDQKLMAEIRNKPIDSLFLYMKEWCKGWDEINVEYLQAERSLNISFFGSKEFNDLASAFFGGNGSIKK